MDDNKSKSLSGVELNDKRLASSINSLYDYIILYEDIIYLYMHKDNIIQIKGKIYKCIAKDLPGLTRAYQKLYGPDYLFVPNDQDLPARHVLKYPLVYYPKMKALWCFNTEKDIEKGYQILFHRKNRVNMNKEILKISDDINDNLEKGINGITQIGVFDTPFEKDYALFSNIALSVLLIVSS